MGFCKIRTKWFKSNKCPIYMEPLGNKKIPKNPICYSCEKCDYNTSNKKDYNKHLNTVKHNGNKLEALGNPKIPISCGQCDKVYQTSAGLWKHKQKCGQKIEETDKTTTSNVTPELVIEIIKQNQEFKNLLIEQSKQIIELSKNVGNNNNNNSHNKTFNLQFFLNETCKDAMNLTDFINSIVLTVSDLDNIGEIGLAKGVANRVVSGLNLLGENKRPIHCTDLKREVMYVKDENKWQKDVNKEKMRHLIKKMNRKLKPLLVEFMKNHNKTYQTDSEIIKHQQKIGEIVGGNKDETTNEDEIIRNISKNVTISKEHQLL